MKRYNITYQHITGAIRVNSYNELFDFYLRLGELMEDEFVTNSSIHFHTEDIKEEEPIFMFYQPTDEEIQREHEHNEFKGFRK